jgi:heme/copper-type cytochrome/quinol oxidase subunit 4
MSTEKHPRWAMVPIAAVVINFVIALAGCWLIIQVQKSNKI